MNNNRKKKTQTQTPGEERLKSFLDMIAPSVIQFYTDHYILSLIHISEPTRPYRTSRMPSSA